MVEHYLPLDCPKCGRHRLLCDGKDVRCEKCFATTEELADAQEKLVEKRESQ